MSARLWLSLQATLASWILGTGVTLPFEFLVLWRNSPPGGLALDTAQGFAFWAALTLLLCLGVWCVIVLPLAILVPAAVLLRRRWSIGWSASLGAVLLIGWRLGTWADLLRPHGPQNPVTAPLFLEYGAFGFTLGWVTTHVYARLLARARVGASRP